MLTRIGRLAALRDESAQMAFAFMLVMVGVFALFGLSLDTGTWYLNHRNAQNEVDAAALAAVQQLPATDTSAAAAVARASLTDNGVDLNDVTCLDFSKTYSDKYDTVKICVRRSSRSYFSSLAHINFATVSASAVATAGPAEGSNVMPFAVIPPDPGCVPGDTCTTFDGSTCAFSTCPWGLTTTHLYSFKSGGGGNTGVIASCGTSGTSDYISCLDGSLESGFYNAGDSVVVGLQGGNLGSNTNKGLSARSPAGAWASSSCDVPSYPSVPKTSGPSDPGGYDPTGAAAAVAKYSDPTSVCNYRLVSIPILASLPPNGGGSTANTVLGVATFGVAGWNRTSNKDTYGTGSSACSLSGSSTGTYDCGMVWGYIMSDVTPPDFLVQRMGGVNPFAPILRALTQ
jgi:Flp pilus assembly protein TadG